MGKNMGNTNLMQFSGSFSQSVLQRNRSQVIQPIGGVNESPLSRPKDMLQLSNEIKQNKIHIFLDYCCYLIIGLQFEKIIRFILLQNTHYTIR